MKSFTLFVFNLDKKRRRNIYLEKNLNTSRRMVRATDKCMEWVKKINTDLKIHTPNFLPLLIKPKHWTNPYDGGYYNENIKFYSV